MDLTGRASCHRPPDSKARVTALITPGPTGCHRGAPVEAEENRYSGLSDDGKRPEQAVRDMQASGATVSAMPVISSDSLTSPRCFPLAPPAFTLASPSPDRAMRG